MRTFAGVMAVLLSSCSLIRSQAPASDYVPPADPLCSDSRLYPVVDLGVGSLFVLSTVGLIVSAASSTSTNNGGAIASAAAGAGLTGLFGFSAYRGFSSASQCDDAHAAAAAYLGGRRAAALPVVVTQESFAARQEREREIEEIQARRLREETARQEQEKAALTPTPPPAAALPEPPGSSPARPIEIDQGAPIKHWALVEGELTLVEKYEDGWHEAGRSLAEAFDVSTVRLLSDPKGRLRDGVRAVKSSYRGSEGWQSLRWGMTLKEVTAAMRGARVKPQREQGFGAAWVTEVADREATVSCLFASDRLVAIRLAIFRIEQSVFADLLTKKYGMPNLTEEDSETWVTKEGRVRAEWDFLHGKIYYLSKVFAPEGQEALERLAAEQAKDL